MNMFEQTNGTTNIIFSGKQTTHAIICCDCWVQGQGAGKENLLGREKTLHIENEMW
jgi:hypothetical protein